MTLLSVRGVSKRFGGLQAVEDVSFDVSQGAIKGLIGPNGAGKTTLFNLLTGFLRPDRGSIVFDAAEVQGLSPHEIAAQGMVRTFQQIRLFPKMTALENIMVGCHLHSRGGFLAGLLNLPFTWKEERRIRKGPGRPWSSSDVPTWPTRRPPVWPTVSNASWNSAGRSPASRGSSCLTNPRRG